MSEFGQGTPSSPSARKGDKAPEFSGGAAAAYDQGGPLPYRDDEMGIETSTSDPHHPFSGTASMSDKYVANANRLVRQGFIRKVFALLTIMLCQSFATVALFLGVESIRNYVQTHASLLYVAFAFNLAAVIAIVCFNDLRRKHPVNLVLLFTYSTAQAYTLGVLASFYTSQSVLMCVGILTVVVFCLTLFALQTSIDFTTMYSSLFGVLMCFVLFGFLNLFFQVQFLDTVYATLGALLFSVYLCADLQLVIGNKKHRLTIDEPVVAALILFQDIVQLFVFLLRLFGERRN